VVDCVRIISVDCYQDWSGTGVEDNWHNMHSIYQLSLV
jgi:hypothetical protein